VQIHFQYNRGLRYEVGRWLSRTNSRRAAEFSAASTASLRSLHQRLQTREIQIGWRIRLAETTLRLNRAYATRPHTGGDAVRYPQQVNSIPFGFLRSMPMLRRHAPVNLGQTQQRNRGA